METVHDIIEALGGTSAFGRAIGVKQSTASEMKRRASIPVEHWPKLILAAKETGKIITNDELVEMHLRRARAI